MICRHSSNTVKLTGFITPQFTHFFELTRIVNRLLVDDTKSLAVRRRYIGSTIDARGCCCCCCTALLAAVCAPARQAATQTTLMWQRFQDSRWPHRGDLFVCVCVCVCVWAGVCVGSLCFCYIIGRFRSVGADAAYSHQRWLIHRLTSSFHPAVISFHGHNTPRPTQSDQIAWIWTSIHRRLR